MLYPKYSSKPINKKHRPLNCLHTTGKISFLGPVLFVSFFLITFTLKIYAIANIYFKVFFKIMDCFAFGNNINLFISSTIQQLLEVDAVSIDYIKFELIF